MHFGASQLDPGKSEKRLQALLDSGDTAHAFAVDRSRGTQRPGTRVEHEEGVP